MAVISEEIFQICVKKFQVYSYARGSLYSLWKPQHLFDATGMQYKRPQVEQFPQCCQFQSMFSQINLNTNFIICRENSECGPYNECFFLYLKLLHFK